MGLDALMRKVAHYITNRPFHEKRHNTIEDDGLIGLLHLAAAVIKHEPPFKPSNEGMVRHSTREIYFEHGENVVIMAFVARFQLIRINQNWDCSLEGIVKPWNVYFWP